VKLRKALTDFVRVIADEAERNPDFANRLAAALGGVDTRGLAHRVSGAGNTLPIQRPKNRRPPPVLDPIEIARQGKSTLRARLTALSIDQLKDIVAEFGMDAGKLVIKWKKADRIIERIVETSMARAQKGDAFRAESKGRAGSEPTAVTDEIDYRGYRLVPFRDEEAWRVQIRTVTATSMPPAEITMKFSDWASAVANAKENLDLFLQGKWR
jgi:hypothetical protein